MKDKVKGLVVGVLLGSLLTGATAFAGTNTKISVVMENVKMMFNGVHKSTTQSIVYNGNLYVPAKTAAQTMGNPSRMTGKVRQPLSVLKLEHLSIWTKFLMLGLMVE